LIFNAYVRNINKDASEKKFDLEKVQHKLKKQEELLEYINQLKGETLTNQNDNELLKELKLEEKEDIDIKIKDEKEMISPNKNPPPEKLQNEVENNDLKDIIQKHESNNNGFLGKLDKIIMKEAKVKTEGKLKDQNKPLREEASPSESINPSVLLINEQKDERSPKSIFKPQSKNSDKELANILANVVFQDDEPRVPLVDNEISNIMRDADNIIKTTNLLEKRNSMKMKIDKMKSVPKKRSTGFLDHVLNINVSLSSHFCFSICI
jgi:hypothetical protein